MMLGMRADSLNLNLKQALLRKNCEQNVQITKRTLHTVSER